jgi:hypothetical protein
MTAGLRATGKGGVDGPFTDVGEMPINTVLRPETNDD